MVLKHLTFTIAFGIMIPLFAVIGLILLLLDGIGRLTDLCLSSLERGETNI